MGKIPEPAVLRVSTRITGAANILLLVTLKRLMPWLTQWFHIGTGICQAFAFEFEVIVWVYIYAIKPYNYMVL